MTHALAAELQAGLQALGLPLSGARQDHLLAHLDLLVKWNRVYNLTAVRDPRQMLTHHLLDCLAIVVPLQRQVRDKPVRVLDVGSGGGLPGVIIAICCPRAEVVCVDSAQKKAAFVQQVKATLALENLHAEHGRVQDMAGRFDVIVSRAFASLVDFVACSRHLLAPGGVWLAMKGRTPAAEIQALGDDVEMFHVEQLSVPGLTAERHLIWMRAAARPG